ncbi:MAG: hypothetical protein ACFFDT_25245 [Candidatus Hodarchaeota archaeon]
MDNNSNLAAFGLCDAVLQNHPSPNFQLSLVSQEIVADDFYIDGTTVDLNYTYSTLVHEEWRSEYWVEARNYIIPASEIDLNDEITFSCTLTAYQDVTMEISHVLAVNWSPDGNTRFRWANAWDGSFDSVPQPNFNVIASSFTESETGKYQFNATVKNTGDPVIQSNSPWQFEEIYYELPLIDGKGKLDETDLDLDLNGDTDKTDEFEVEWVPTSGSQYDAIIEGTYVYSLDDITLNSLSGHPRRYYIDNKPKTFTLGTETHILYSASADRLSLGFYNAHIIRHPSPYFRLLVFANVTTSDFKVNGEAAEAVYTWTMDAWEMDKHTHWIVPIESDIDTGEEVTFSCTLIAHETKTSDIYFLIQWSPDGDTSYRMGKVWEESFKEYITTTTTTSTTTTTTTTTNGTPGFSLLTSLLLFIPVLFYKHRKKKH